MGGARENIPKTQAKKKNADNILCNIRYTTELNMIFNYRPEDDDKCLNYLLRSDV